jgi:hypothetical protein
VARDRVRASSRGERVQRGAVFPTIGNTVVWRSIYFNGTVLRMDRVRVPWFLASSHSTVAAVPRASDPHRDFARLSWFADGWVARSPSDPSLIGDARYSLSKSRYDPVWGIRIRPDGTTEWVDRSRERLSTPFAGSKP